MLNNKSEDGMVEQIIREIKQEREKDIIIRRIEEEAAGLTFHLPFYPCRTTPPIQRYHPAPITWSLPDRDIAETNKYLVLSSFEALFMLPYRS